MRRSPILLPKKSYENSRYGGVERMEKKEKKGIEYMDAVDSFFWPPG